MSKKVKKWLTYMLKVLLYYYKLNKSKIKEAYK